MLLGLQIYFFFLTLQKQRKIKGRNTRRGEQATFQILEKGLSSWRRGLFLWIWRKGPIPSFQMKHCPWFHPSVKWKLFLWPGSPAMWLVVCFWKQRAKVLQGCGVKNQTFTECPVRRGPYTSVTPYFFSAESTNTTYWPLSQTKGSRSSHKASAPQRQQPFRSTGLSCFNMYTEVHHDMDFVSQIKYDK